MKRIIVPTDFSANAERALHYAIMVANNINAAIHVVHTINTRGTGGRYTTIDDLMYDERQEKMQDLLHRVKKLLAAGVLISSSIAQDYTVDGILKTVDEKRGDLVIMGTQGASGLKRLLLGSTTVEFIKKTQVPVLIVPAEYTEMAIRHIALAIDESEISSLYLLQPAILLANKFKTTVSLVHVSKNGDAEIDKPKEEEVGGYIRAHMEKVQMPYDLYNLKGNSVSKILEDFVATKDVDILCLLNQSEQRSWWANLFHDSVTNELAYGSKKPLLVIKMPA